MDAALQIGAGYAQFEPKALDQFLVKRRAPAIEAWAAVTYGLVRINDVAVPVLGVDPGKGSVAPSIAEGRAPSQPKEIALGEDTLADVGASIGDEVDIEGTRHRVVGRAVLPALGQATGDHPALGVGGWLSGDDLRERFPPDRPDFLASAILLRMRDGVDVNAVVDPLVEAMEADPLAWGALESDAAEPSGLVQALTPAQPAELVGTAGSLGAARTPAALVLRAE